MENKKMDGVRECVWFSNEDLNEIFIDAIIGATTQYNKEMNNRTESEDTHGITQRFRDSLFKILDTYYSIWSAYHYGEGSENIEFNN